MLIEQVHPFIFAQLLYGLAAIAHYRNLVAHGFEVCVCARHNRAVDTNKNKADTHATPIRHEGIRHEGIRHEGIRHEGIQHEDLVVHEQHEGVVTLTLNQPQRFNPLSEAMLASLAQNLDTVSTDADVRVVILAAQGPAFCAGHDLREMLARPSEQYYKALFQKCTEVMLKIIECPVPVIARVHGLATAAGCQLVATCDLAVAADTARFAVSGVTLGLFCSNPGVALTGNVSRKQAFEMLFTGEFIDAPTALRYGLVNRTGPSYQLDAIVQDLCASIKQHPPVAVRTGKRLFYHQQRQALRDAYRHAGDVMACNMMEQDTREGVQAFLDKRAPRWPHRD